MHLVLFVYDCLRLFFLLSLLALSAGSSGGFLGISGGAGFPFMVYAAPNALFPLMSFFLMIRPAESRAFAPLYASGKIIAAAALSAWIVLAVLRRGAISPAWAFFLGAADLASAAGAVLLKVPNQPAAAQSAEAEIQPADERGEE